MLEQVGLKQTSAFTDSAQQNEQKSMFPVSKGLSLYRWAHTGHLSYNLIHLVKNLMPV